MGGLGARDVQSLGSEPDSEYRPHVSHSDLRIAHTKQGVEERTTLALGAADEDARSCGCPSSPSR